MSHTDVFTEFTNLTTTKNTTDETAQLLTQLTKQATTTSEDTLATLKEKLANIAQLLLAFSSISEEAQNYCANLYADIKTISDCKTVIELKTNPVMQKYLRANTIESNTGKELLLQLLDNAYVYKTWDNKVIFHAGTEPTLRSYTKKPIKYQLEDIAKKLHLHHQKLNDTFFATNPHNDQLQIAYLNTLAKLTNYQNSSENEISIKKLEESLQQSFHISNKFYKTLTETERINLEKILNANNAVAVTMIPSENNLYQETLVDTTSNTMQREKYADDATFFIDYATQRLTSATNDDLLEHIPPLLENQAKKVLENLGQLYYQNDLLRKLDQQFEAICIINKAIGNI